MVNGVNRKTSSTPTSFALSSIALKTSQTFPPLIPHHMPRLSRTNQTITSE
ncbi:hypothetical protein SODALDRAFT_359267 [Sodiomyces alkalinus F11]|uniref:Uncharacterized protein n=1 Tax=Sodiomyces alkalinus (strain CBS 110278 / VKM F-3762 / F11) TaxID=1314773 RepID=A0A3N2PY23_SODAK|nr:hypothetical protein SODALDRAFT_359267 [Sodiomyces alkalinus F11]ROT39374.1 hypothetical protein SODALDRAFT_359267 [Sodiomyces alkalinus F11]